MLRGRLARFLVAVGLVTGSTIGGLAFAQTGPFGPSSDEVTTSVESSIGDQVGNDLDQTGDFDLQEGDQDEADDADEADGAEVEDGDQGEADDADEAEVEDGDQDDIDLQEGDQDEADDADEAAAQG